MRNVCRSALVPYSGDQMSALVEDVDAYSQFLPWCQASEVLSRDGNTVEAAMEIGRGPAAMRFSTRNTSTPGRRLEMQLIDGPFRQLSGIWQFDPIDDQGCRVTLEMHFEFSNAAMAALFGAIFEKTVDSLVDAFTQRAEAVYGRR